MKLLKIMIIPVLCMIMLLSTFASTGSIYVFEFEDEQKTVTFEQDTSFSAQEQQAVAQRLVYGAPEDDGTSTYAWCWLTGHDYTYDSVSVTTHKARPISPRCYRETYEIETCTKCDHFQEELLTGVYILCCPED